MNERGLGADDESHEIGLRPNGLEQELQNYWITALHLCHFQGSGLGTN